LFPEADSRARAATFGCQLRNCRHRNLIAEDTCGFHAISPSRLTRPPTLCHLLPAIYHNLHSPSPPIRHGAMGHSQSKTSARGSKHNPQQTNSLQPFTYTPLAGPRNFRILHLARRRREASANHEDLELHASLVEASLDSVPKYFALSYTWGDPAPVGKIFINGRVLGITRNCADALQRMLRGKAERLIWVDSICINQGGMCVCVCVCVVLFLVDLLTY
jgi:hypothetical protein